MKNERKERIKTIKRIALWWVLMLLAAAVVTYGPKAFACTAFFKGEYIDGLNKICLYDHLGSTHAETFRSYQVCPVTVQVPH